MHSIFLELLAILFIGLKLMGYIDWSWWLVTLPIWGGLVLGLVVMFCVFLWAKYNGDI